MIKIPAIWHKVLLGVFCIFCFLPWCTPAIALISGVVFAWLFSHPNNKPVKKWTSRILKASVIGLGFGLHLSKAWELGKAGLLFTCISIIFIFVMGLSIGRIFNIKKDLNTLITTGTAICGGSAIAAIAPVIKADDQSISASMGIVFLLNAIALIVFPFIGEWLDLSPYQFGYWAAMAIHDTSSVVGATSMYGQHSEINESLLIGTTLKLTRALYIIPVSIVFAFLNRGDKKFQVPWFILLFIFAACIATIWPQGESIYKVLLYMAKKGLALSLFLIGTGIHVQSIKNIGTKPLLAATLLWVLVGGGLLIACMYDFV